MIPSEIPVRYTRGITQHDRGSNCVRFFPIPTFATASENSPGVPSTDPPGPGSSGSGGAGGAPSPVDQIGLGLDQWVFGVRDLLDDLQTPLEQAHDSAVGEHREELGALLANLRECRAKLPGPDVLRAWLRYLISSLG